jgi:hypothetical protein
MRNRLLREDDWRFAFRSVADPRGGLLILERPDGAALRRAGSALPAGGAVLCRWRRPLPGGARRVRRALQGAGFEEIRLHWAWPPPHRASPHFWLPLDTPAAAAHLFRIRPAGNRRQAALRRLWRLAARIGVLTPTSATARKPGPRTVGEEEIESQLRGTLGDGARNRSWLLLTGGGRSINKVVGLPFEPGQETPGVAVKFARLGDAEAGLEREARVLAEVARTHPTLGGIPRVLATGRRAGRLAVAETAIHGKPLLGDLTAESFPRLAGAVTEWLLGLADGGRSPGEAEWRARLIEGPLAEFERSFAAAGGGELAGRARALLDDLPDLPAVPEHRDCSPWNVVLGTAEEPALLDWESAEPNGLPGMDLAYFLANAAFVLEGALESGRTRQAYDRLLDPASATGAVFASCASRYCERLSLSAASFARLRLLCWIVHARSDHRHLEMAAGRPPGAAALSSSLYLDLLREDLTRQESGR